MNVSSALTARKSIRSFLSAPVSSETLTEIFSFALHAPSNCNVQPWQVHLASGATRDSLSESLLNEIISGIKPYPEVDWQLQFDEEMQERKYASAAALYDAMGISRNDKYARKTALLRNWSFFDAPHVAIFTLNETLGTAGAVDLGIFSQSVSLAALERGVSSCFQAALNQYPGPIRKLLNIPSHQKVVFGMSLGYADDSAPVNNTITEREPLEHLIHFHV